MRFLTRMNWNFSRAIRTILVIALAVLAISAMKVAPDVEEWHLVVVAAIGSMALINLELKDKRPDQKVRIIITVGLAAIAAWVALVIEAGEERRFLFVALSWVISFALSLFALYVVLITVCPLVQSTHFNEVCNSA